MDCVFCKIISGEIPCKKIAENEYAIAFLDVNPISDGHTLVIPKAHFKNLSTCSKESLNGVMALAQEVAILIEGSELKPWGFNYISNEGDVAGQVVFHFHMHVIPKYSKNEGFAHSLYDNSSSKFVRTETIRLVNDVNIVYEKILRAKNK